MFYAHNAGPTEYTFVKNMIQQANLPCQDLERHYHSYLIGELNDQPVAVGGLEIYGSVALLRNVVVTPAERGGHLGETMARALINLADKRGVKFIYTLLDDPHMGYLFAKMRYVPCTRTELIENCPESKMPQLKPQAEAWKLDLDFFFNSGCSCSIPE